MHAVTDRMGLAAFCAGTHPFARWSEQQVTEGERYARLIDRTQWWGRQMLVYGVHVHVGVDDVRKVMPTLSALLAWFPHLQALSASSPFWDGADTGYASNRAMMFQQLPTAGLPFQFDDWAGYEAYVADMFTTGVIEEPRRDPVGHPPRRAPGHHRDPRLRRRAEPGRGGRADRARAVPRGRPRPPPRRRRDAADAAALARAGEQVARRPLRARRRDHPRREGRRAAGHRRPGRPAHPPRAARPRARVRRRAWPRSNRSGAAARAYQRQRAVREAAGGDLRAVVDSLVAEPARPALTRTDQREPVTPARGLRYT
nr:YbdK family carboxylate-amine ligase [Angustibacter aerolatus]